MKQKIFINLTNGIEAIPELAISDISFIRIQSCHCERQKFELIIDNLDYNFLMYLALGYECIVYDFGVNSDVSYQVAFYNAILRCGKKVIDFT